MIFIGFAFALMLAFIQNINLSANRFLALALLTMILWMMRILAMDIGLQSYMPGWDRLPMQCLLTLGPFMYFYVLKITKPSYQFNWKDLLHLSPWLLEQGTLLIEVKESNRTGAYTYATTAFYMLNPVLQLLIFTSIMYYLYRSHKLIQMFYGRLPPVLMDRSLLEFRWLRRLLAATALLWLLWMAYAVVNYWGYGNQLSLHQYYPFYVFFVVIIIWTAVAAFLKPQATLKIQSPSTFKASLTTELKQKGIWLKKVVKENRYYDDPDLSLNSLAVKLNISPHELSRIINTAVKKSFNDFINEYRLTEVIRKMQHPAYARLTLLGIAYGSGFNSKSTFGRAFRQVTGKNPGEYYNELKKEGSSYKLNPSLRSTAIILNHETANKWVFEKSKRSYMFKNNLKIAWRNFAKNKVSSFINTSGLALGIAVALLIGLYVYDEFSFNKSFANYDRIAKVMVRWKLSYRVKFTQSMGLGYTLKNNFRDDFERVIISSGTEGHVLAFGDKKFSEQGKFMLPEGTETFSFNMQQGNRNGLASPNTIMLSASEAKKLFGNTDPMGKVLKMDNKMNLTVTGVYADFPENTEFKGLEYFSPLDAYMMLNPALANTQGDWNNTWVNIYAQLSPKADFDKVSAKISQIKSGHIGQEEKAAGPSVFLQPMSKWHLHSAFGMGGIEIESVAMHTIWLYGIIGVFVLLLACINFMNLSTARSEKRAREVGVRKVMGSARGQLVGQFFTESILTALFAFAMAIVLVLLILPRFNSLSGKQLGLLWANPYFWLAGIAFTVFTGLAAGAYPAIYLSSFSAIKVLQGRFRTGRFATMPRKALVVLQFAVSITLIIGTAVVYRQVKFAKDRPVGYNQQSLLEVPVTDPNFTAFDVLENELVRAGGAVQVTESNSPITDISFGNSGFKWRGKDEAFKDQFGTLAVTPSYGKTVGWKFLDGRDFSKEQSDSAGFVINEAAAKYMQFKKPIGEIMQWPRFGTKNFRIIGVVKDMVMNSPFDPSYPTLFYLSAGDPKLWIFIKLNPHLSAAAALPKVAEVFGKLMPAVPFQYQFADDDYAAKFAAEERMLKFAVFFAILAILISCMGLFGLTSFVAEQRTKEIGIRKVLGASVISLWGMLSKEFLLLVTLSFVAAVPVAFYLMKNWLQNYQYRAGLSWWIFAATGIGAMAIALITVSFQSVKAALMNPVKSLKSE